MLESHGVKYAGVNCRMIQALGADQGILNVIVTGIVSRIVGGHCTANIMRGYPMNARVNYITDVIFNDINDELARARNKFPDNKFLLNALFEEVGELSQAMIQRECEPDKSVKCADIYKEAVQVAVMAIRVATEGDHTLRSYDPGLGYRGYKKPGV